MATPDIMDAAIAVAKTPEGFADRWKILQTTGIAPVPRSQVTNMTIRNSYPRQTQAKMQMPRLEDVVRHVHELTERDVPR
jgi:hypothetical protein